MSDCSSVWRRRTALSGAAPTPGLLRLVESLEERDALRVRVDLKPRDRRVADAAARPVGDPRERDAVERVVDHLQVRDGVLDLGPLVEARAADHLVGDLLADEHVLQHARLGVRPVEDRDLGAGVALVDQPRDLGGDEARLRVLVLDLDHAHRVALPQLAEEVLRLALAVVRDQRVRGAEDRVRRAVVLLERDRLRAAEVALELEDVADVGAAERVDRLVGVADREDVPVLARRAAAGAGTARGSCPGTRRRGRSGRPSATSPARPGCCSSTSTVRMIRSSKSIAFEACRRRW